MAKQFQKNIPILHCFLVVELYPEVEYWEKQRPQFNSKLRYQTGELISIALTRSDICS